jgi:hypothetical protein
MEQLLLIIKASASGVMSAIVALNQGLDLIGKAISPVTALFESMWNIGTGTFNAIYSAAEATADFLIQSFVNAIEAITAEWLDFEATSTKIFNNIANEVGASLEEIKNTGLSVSTQMGKDLSNTMDGLYEIIGSGFRDVEEAGQLMNSAGKLAQAGNTKSFTTASI